ncbi:MAG: lysostaphin resistance A-like protein [Planctomycetota bacterium]
MPEPLNRWSYFFYSLAKPWWSKHVLAAEQFDQMRNVLLWLIINIVFGLMIPAIVLLLSRRRLTDVGIGLPNVLGRRMIIISVIISIPFGLWLLKTTPDLSGMSLTNPAYTCALLAMIPEHFLICGTFVALMLPQRILPNPVSIAPLEGPALTRCLRWIGLAQPASPGHNRFLAWFGLTGVSLFAILVSGTLFGITHFGKELPELFMSFPGGVAVAYVTLRSHSIWPAILAHWAMNLIPLAILSLRG